MKMSLRWSRQRDSLRTLPEASWIALVATLASVGAGLWFVNPIIAGAYLFGVVLTGISIAHPDLVLALSLAAAYIPIRVLHGNVDISFPDIALLVASLVALFHIGGRHSTALRSLLGLVLLYEFVLTVPVVLNPTMEAVIEWGHRGFLLAGGVLIGAAIAKRGSVETALRVYLAASTLIAAASIVNSVRTGFVAGAPLGLSKNYAGSLLGIALVLLLFSGLGIIRNRFLLGTTAALLVLGLLATQSRGALLALLPAVGYILWRRRRLGLRAWIILAISGMVALVYTDLALSSQTIDTRLNSVGTRVSFLEAAYGFWIHAPIGGAGLRYYLDPQFQFPYPAGDPLARPSPHNLVLEVVSESGIIGFVGLAILFLGVLRILRRAETSFAVAAAGIQIGIFAHALVDIFWLAGITSLIWTLTAMAAGRAPKERVVEITHKGPAGQPNGLT